MFIVVFLIVAFIIPINNKYPNNEGSDSLNNNNSYDNPIDIQYELISKKVIPYIVNAKVTIDNESSNVYLTQPFETLSYNLSSNTFLSNE